MPARQGLKCCASIDAARENRSAESWLKFISNQQKGYSPLSPLPQLATERDTDRVQPVKWGTKS